MDPITLSMNAVHGGVGIYFNRMSQGGKKLREAKASVIAAQQLRTDERVAHYRKIEESARLVSTASVVAHPSSLTTGIWQAITLGPDHFVWSRTLLCGKEEWFTASATASGDFDLRHSTS